MDTIEIQKNMGCVLSMLLDCQCDMEKFVGPHDCDVFGIIEQLVKVGNFAVPSDNIANNAVQHINAAAFFIRRAMLAIGFGVEFATFADRDVKACIFHVIQAYKDAD